MIEERSTEQTIRLYYDVYSPDARANGKPLVIATHGYEGTKESMMNLSRRINDVDYVIASLQGPNAFFASESRQGAPRLGFGWMMQYKVEETIRLHHQSVRSIIDELDREGMIDPGRVFLLGFSQTVSLNYRFAFTYPGSIAGIVAVCGGIPGNWDTGPYRDCETDVLIVAGERDEFYPAERTRTFPEALLRRARSVEYRLYDEGHRFPRESFGDIAAWLKART